MAQQSYSSWLTRWRNSTLICRLGTLTSGTILAQVLQLINFGVLAKIYSLSEVGVYSIFAAVVGTLAPLTLLTYDTLIPNISDDDLKPYLKAVLLLIFPLAILLALLFMLASYSYAQAVGLWLAGAAIHRIAEMYNVRLNYFGWISLARLAPPLMMTLLLVALAWFDLKGIDRLIEWQAVLTLVFGLIYVVLTLPRNVLINHITTTMMVSSLRKAVNAPFYLMPSTLLNLSAYNMPILVIGHWFGSELAAQYAYVLRFGFGPVGLIGGTLYQVFYGFLAEASRTADKMMFREFIQARRYIGYVSIIVALAIAFIYPPSFIYLLGPEWVNAGWISIIFSPMFAVMIYVTTQSVALNVFSRQDYELKSQIYYFSLSILSFGLAIISDNVWTGFVIFSTLSLLRYFLLLRDINKVLLKNNILNCKDAQNY